MDPIFSRDRRAAIHTADGTWIAGAGPLDTQDWSIDAQAWLADAEGIRLAITLSDAQRAAVVDVLTSRFQTELAAGLTITGSDAIAAGFKVAVTDKEVEHDFTGDAVAEALGQLLRTDLATIVKGAVVA